MKRLPPEEIEEVHVNKVYDEIASHFDHTRYKPWPGVRNFVSSLEPNSLLLDLGCGNGRNLCINPKVIDMASDMSMPLCQIASKRGRPVFCATGVNIPIRDNTFDHVICIAVIHHFASAERRIQCLKEISRILKVGGTAFVTAWAIEQKSKEQYDQADQMIPWTIDKRFGDSSKKLERFYHLFEKGEFAQLVKDIDSLELLSEEWEKDNWNATFKKLH
ncbi:hypothetical protein TRFO_01670 [Tritrichomonas foetus]|uniref:Methyltransferase type 11 domain-containing protein n=1 Tax=Tritrichomonas foetus TaxID=1144522 RepID=A0A1J4JU94_9EUKA|nr:hypothetical protein TRFO_01670 [Tritrichomonas foetus]|eukprot:OHT01094.1 hypothetical protein TRFO_01670 [Tritrichomonas foetus]